MANEDPHDLHRFLKAQDQDGAYEHALEELRRGRKQSHWMWFVFPQLRGLGRSWMAEHYGIASLEEARAYLSHPVLGRRLLECSSLVAATEATSADAVFGSVDAVKLRSSMTLFREADPRCDVFQRVLERFYDGLPDLRTLERL